MSIWAGIKYALNSTLGTPKFKPLNELIESHIGLIESSDKVYYNKAITGSIQGGSAGYENVVQKISKKVKINAQGTARVYVDWSAYADADAERPFSAEVQVLKNNTILSKNSSVSQYSAGTQTQRANANVCNLVLTGIEIGDEFEFVVVLKPYGDRYAPNIINNTFDFSLYAEPAIVGTNLVEVI